MLEVIGPGALRTAHFLELLYEIRNKAVDL